MIQTETDLQQAYEEVTRLYALRESCRSEDLWHPSTRADAIAGVQVQIDHTENEILNYLLAKHNASDRLEAEERPVRTGVADPAAA